MDSLIFMFIIIGLPVLAAKGMWYRGAWFGTSALAVVFFGVSCLGSFSANYRALDEPHHGVMLDSQFELLEQACEKEKEYKRKYKEQPVSKYYPPPPTTGSTPACDSIEEFKEKALEREKRGYPDSAQWSLALFIGSFLAGCFYRAKRPA